MTRSRKRSIPYDSFNHHHHGSPISQLGKTKVAVVYFGCVFVRKIPSDVIIHIRRAKIGRKEIIVGKKGKEIENTISMFTVSIFAVGQSSNQSSRQKRRRTRKGLTR